LIELDLDLGLDLDLHLDLDRQAWIIAKKGWNLSKLPIIVTGIG
jgi:hypothetical protein